MTQWRPTEAEVGYQGVTTRLAIQFRHPVSVDMQADAWASLLHESPSYYILRAEVTQGGTFRAVAEGVFTDKATGGAKQGDSQ